MGDLPEYAQGRMRTCHICGYWWPERSGKIIKIEGQWRCVETCIDEVEQKDFTNQRRSR